MKKITVFLSGPGASHNPDYRRAFLKAQDQLEARRFYVVNLACAFPVHWPHTLVMPHCLKAIQHCDAILMLPGWKKSKGATREYQEATNRGIPAFDHIDALMCYFSPGGDTP